MRYISTFLFCTALIGSVTACTAIIDVRGNVPAADRLEQIKPGQTTRAEVATLVGTPASKTTFGDNAWYYISSKIETYAFFDPEELERHVVEITFNPKSDIVESVRSLELKDGQEVRLVSRETPTAGKDMSVLEQLIGNFGRFSATDSRKRGTVPGQ